MEAHHKEETRTRSGGILETPSRARPGRRAHQRAPGSWASRGARSGIARTSDTATSSSQSCGPTTYGASQRGRVHHHQGGSESRRRQWTGPGQHRLSLGIWNVTKLAGKEPELVREVEQYQLDLVGITSTHSLISGTKLLDRGRTLSFSGVA